MERPKIQDVLKNIKRNPGLSGVLEYINKSKQDIPTYSKPIDKDISDFHNEEKLKEFAPYIKEANNFVKEKLGTELPKGLLPAILSQESSFGTVEDSKNPEIGDKAYLLGLTNTAKEELKKAGIEADFNDTQGAFNAAAAYFALRQNVYDYDQDNDKQILNTQATDEYKNNPTKTYTERYYGGKLPVEDLFKKRYEYYNQLDY